MLSLFMRKTAKYQRLDAVQRRVDAAYHAGFRDGQYAPRASRVVRAFPAPKDLPSLTDRQVEVLILAAKGHSNQAIADELGVTLQTVKFHLSNAYATLGAKNRTGAVTKARELGVLA